MVNVKAITILAKNPIVIPSQHRQTNIMDSRFYLETVDVDEALSGYGVPEIFKTDQGSQCTSEAFSNKLKGEQTPPQHG